MSIVDAEVEQCKGQSATLLVPNEHGCIGAHFGASCAKLGASGETFWPATSRCEGNNDEDGFRD